MGTVFFWFRCQRVTMKDYLYLVACHSMPAVHFHVKVEGCRLHCDRCTWTQCSLIWWCSTHFSHVWKCFSTINWLESLADLQHKHQTHNRLEPWSRSFESSVVIGRWNILKVGVYWTEVLPLVVCPRRRYQDVEKRQFLEGLCQCRKTSHLGALLSEGSIK